MNLSAPIPLRAALSRWTLRLPGLHEPALGWLVLSLSLAAAPHLARTPPWIAILFAAIAFWRLRTPRDAAPGRAGGRVTGTLLHFLVGIIVVGGVYASYSTLTGRDAGVALLALLAGMKLLELRDERDFYVTVSIGLFLLLTNFFYIQSILSSLYMVANVISFLAALISINDPRHRLGRLRTVAMAGSLFLQALPLMLILFLLFPRVPGPLWGLPKDARAASTGIDDEMAPGMISQLALSDDVAFRVEFDGPVPPRSTLYWRGPVLWYTDGVKWTADRWRSDIPEVRDQGSPVRYTVTLEPTGKNWLFGLELPVSPPARARFTHDMQIRTASPVENRLRYSLESYPDHVLYASSERELGRALQLPPGRHPRTIALAKSWREAGLGDRAIVARALNMFDTQNFYYTLTPPPLLNDTVDQFLFETRRGFCEHYAAAFVVLMRAAGIPARVVTGYQGGTVNPVGNYLIVRQRDAHAWAEVWMKGLGWIREDPTAAVAPSRVLEGIDEALPGALIDVPAVFRDSVIARTLLDRFRFTWDAINNRWNQWVLGYDTNRQSLFLRSIGLDWLDLPGLVVGLTLCISVLLLAVAAWLFRVGAAREDEPRRLYETFCRRMARLGVARLATEGPRDFARRAVRRLPGLAAPIARVTDLYVEARYADRLDRIPALRQAVRAFPPGRSTELAKPA